jgi:hypothetical protein
MNIFKKKIKKIIILSLLALMAASFFCVNSVVASTMVDGETGIMEIAVPAKVESASITFEEDMYQECRGVSPLGSIASETKTAVRHNDSGNVPMADQLACCRDKSHRTDAINQGNGLNSASVSIGAPLVENIYPKNTAVAYHVSINISPPGDIALDTIIIRE